MTNKGHKMQTIEQRCDQAVASRKRTVLNWDASSEEIEASLSRSQPKPSRPQPDPKPEPLNAGMFDVPVVEDAYRINDETFIIEEPEKGSGDPEFKLIDDAYRISASGKVWFPLAISPTHGSAERILKYVKRQGFTVYWPRRVAMEMRGQGRRRRKTVIVASLWPRYVLVHMPAKGTVLTNVADWRDYAQRLRDLGYATQAEALERKHKDRDRDEKPVVIGQPYKAAFGAVRTLEGQFNGVGDWLKNALGPIQIADRHVERIVARERAGEFNQTYRKGKKRMSKLPEWCIAGNLVRVVDGPFAGFQGLLEEVDEAKERVKASVDIFGRATIVDLELVQVSELC